jgi:hypothetical protein
MDPTIIMMYCYYTNFFLILLLLFATTTIHNFLLGLFFMKKIQLEIFCKLKIIISKQE